MKASFWNAAILLLLSGLPALGGNWNARLAASYLDGREKDWFAWPSAKAAGGTCVSCHTGVAYLLARPALRSVLGEAQPTPYETGLLDGVKERTVQNKRMFASPAFAKEPLVSQAAGVQSILSALLLARADGPQAMSAATRQAFDRMWSAQNQVGPAKGGWPWFALDTDPFETTESSYYGAALAALAVAATPASYREMPDVKAHVDDLAAYLRSAEEGQPLHNRLMLLWVAGAIPHACPRAEGEKLLQEALAKQQPDGGWTMDSLGPWKQHPAAAVSPGSSAYATAVVALSFEQAGIPASSPGLAEALAWLRSHQNPSGYWDAISMNKIHEPGSMMELFMRDAATSYAALALAIADLRDRI